MGIGFGLSYVVREIGFDDWREYWVPVGVMKFCESRVVYFVMVSIMDSNEK